jgi:hypothetical protein
MDHHQQKTKTELRKEKLTEIERGRAPFSRRGCMSSKTQRSWH